MPADGAMQQLQLPAVGQIGVVVEDVDRAIAFYRSTFGLGPFERQQGLATAGLNGFVETNGFSLRAHAELIRQQPGANFVLAQRGTALPRPVIELHDLAMHVFAQGSRESQRRA